MTFPTGADLPPGVDPRPAPSDEAAALDSGGALRPAVAGAGFNSGLWLVGGGALALGVLAFLVLSSHRAQTPQEIGAVQPPSSPAVAAPVIPPPPPALDAMEAASRSVRPAPVTPVPAPPPRPPVVTVATPPPPPSAAPKSAVATPAPLEAAPPSRAPVLMIDLPPPEASPRAATGTAQNPNVARLIGMNSDEQFAERVETGQEPERARATMLRNQSTVVPQGAMIPAVLETALNSDLPGYARAVVSRDVRSFNGSTVLIPRGSRVVGEYRSAVALGQSRAFVIWTRVLRPDGGSIQIGSGGGDTLGRAGLAGKVDRHFFERFSGAILLTVLNAGATALAGTPSTQVVIGSSQQATGLAGSVVNSGTANISPTIKVAQGTPVRIFVARDLDFTPVEGQAR